MKKVLWTKKRKDMMLLLSIVLLLGGIIGTFFFNRPTVETGERTIYSYSVTADSDYRVNIKPNMLYDTEWLEAGKAYPGSLTKQIEMTLLTGFSGSEQSDVAGSYEIKAVLEGYYSGSSGKAVLYRKEYPLKNGDFQEAEVVRGEWGETIAIMPEVYRDFSQEADAILGGNTSCDLMIEFSGQYSIQTPYGDREESFSYIRVLPVIKGTEIYEIAPKDKLVQEQVISEPEETFIPAGTVQLLPFILVIISGIVLFCFCWFFTRRPTESEAAAVEGQQILKKYASRMILLKYHPEFGDKQKIYLDDMDKLILLSEELQKPVFYCVEEDSDSKVSNVKDGMFYIFDDQNLYLFQTSI